MSTKYYEIPDRVDNSVSSFYPDIPAVVSICILIVKQFKKFLYMLLVSY